MTVLPSIFAASSVPLGHMYHTQTTPPRALSVPNKRGGGPLVLNMTLGATSMKASASQHTLANSSVSEPASTSTLGFADSSLLSLPTRGHAASDFVYRSWHSTHKNSSRSRTEWLGRADAQIYGEIRNIKVLGMVKDHLVVAYQGQGRIKTFIEHGSTLELQEVPHVDGASKLYKKYVDTHNHHFRFAAYQKPRLPAKIMVVGESEPDGINLVKKPVREAVTTAKVPVSGHVTENNSFLVAL